MMKKKLYIVFAVLLVMSIFTVSCAQSTPQDTAVPTKAPEDTAEEGKEPTEKPKPSPTEEEVIEPVELTFWNNWDNVNMEVINELVDDFNEEHPNIQVESVFQPYGEMMTLLQTAIASGNTPDVAAADLIFLPQLVETEGIQPLDDYIAQDEDYNVEDFYPRLSGYDVIEGKRYAIPMSANNMQLIWNKDLFEAAGLDPDMPPTTWEEMKSMASTCQNLDEGIVGFEFFTQPVGEGITWQFQVWLWAAGGEFLNEDNTAAAFNSPEGIKALTYVSDMLQGNGSQPGEWGRFGEQKACMQLDGSWLFGYRKDAPFAWDIALVPAPEGGTTATNIGGEHLFIFQDSPNKQAAWEFVKYLTSKDVQLKWDKMTGFLPVRESVGESSEYRQWVEETEPRMLPFVEGMEYAHTRPATPKYNEVSQAFSSEIQPALLGDISPEQALENAEEAVNEILSQ